MRAGILTEDDIPREISDVLGHSHSARINTLVEDMDLEEELGVDLELEEKVNTVGELVDFVESKLD